VSVVTFREFQAIRACRYAFGLPFSVSMNDVTLKFVISQCVAEHSGALALCSVLKLPRVLRSPPPTTAADDAGAMDRRRLRMQSMTDAIINAYARCDGSLFTLPSFVLDGLHNYDVIHRCSAYRMHRQRQVEKSGCRATPGQELG